MAEPQPAAVTEGATEENVTAQPTGEAAATAKGLSNLDGNNEDDANTNNADTEALGKAMKNLNVKEAPAKQEVKKVVKLDAEDVKIVMEELMFSKRKAEELLRKHSGNAVEAMVAYVTAPV